MSKAKFDKFTYHLNKEGLTCVYGWKGDSKVWLGDYPSELDARKALKDGFSAKKHVSTSNRNADRIDGYDRDDLGHSPDY